MENQNTIPTSVMSTIKTYLDCDNDDLVAYAEGMRELSKTNKFKNWLEYYFKNLGRAFRIHANFEYSNNELNRRSGIVRLSAADIEKNIRWKVRLQAMYGSDADAVIHYNNTCKQLLGVVKRMVTEPTEGSIIPNVSFCKILRETPTVHFNKLIYGNYNRCNTIGDMVSTNRAFKNILCGSQDTENTSYCTCSPYVSKESLHDTYNLYKNVMEELSKHSNYDEVKILITWFFRVTDARFQSYANVSRVMDIVKN